MLLTQENYKQGFLVDQDLMAGITESPEQPGTFAAFVLQHTTGEYIGYQLFPSLEKALTALNGIPRSWSFERLGGGCGGKCGTGEGGCQNGSCGQAGKCGTGGGCGSI